VTASVGLAMAEPGTPFELALHDADLAMYAVKQRRNGRFNVASEEVSA
jgi:GGDEF domain-containing protein